MDDFEIALTISVSIISSLGLTGVFGWLIRHLVKERITNSIKYEYDVKLERIRSELLQLRSEKSQESDQAFNIAAGSHMAIKVFDNQVEFSKKYMEKAVEAFTKLRVMSEYSSAIDYSQQLTQIRADYGLWLSLEIDKDLSIFEYYLKQIGVNQQLIKVPEGEFSDDDFKRERVQELMDLLAAFMNPSENTRFTEMKISYVIDCLRSILGVQELVMLRNQAVIKYAKAMC